MGVSVGWFFMNVFAVQSTSNAATSNAVLLLSKADYCSVEGHPNGE